MKQNFICLFLLITCGTVWLTSAESFKRTKRQAIGSSCNENIDCLTTNGGAYCDSTKVCACLPTSVNIGGFCWPKINPGQSGCLYNDQCAAIWPGATCDSSNTCACPNSKPPSTTSDGQVCNNDGACPTNGLYSKMKDPRTGADVACTNPLAPTCGGATEYDCFCTPPAPPATVCFGPGVLGFCCPTRALACIMPKEEGTFNGGLRQNKWYFNSASNNCEQLSFNGAGGNANNFDSKLQCESYCKTACPRGRPLYSGDSSDLVNRQQIVTCSTSTSNVCPSTHYCNTATTSSGFYCCPTPTFVCGPVGGVIPGAGIDPGTVPDSGIAGINLPTRTRYYYDSSTSTCKTFIYNGQGGNYNNFATAAECNAFCARSTCTAGDMLRDGSQNPLRCGTAGSTTCPAKYECTSTGYCCPTKDFVCNQPVATGSCLNYVSRWFYDVNARSCSQFTYNGCQGNFNNFNTYTDCVAFCTDVSVGPKCPQGTAAKDTSNTYIVCSGTASTNINSCPAGYYCYYDGSVYGCCPTSTQTCSFETSDSGTPCITPVTRWYLNTQNARCQTFTYNGCDGNSNNFPTQLDCQDYCNVGGCPDGGEPYRQTTNGQYQTCTNTGNECPSGYSCSTINLGTSTTATYCCPTKDTVCRMSQDVGTSCGTNTLTRYSFNPSTRTCDAFTYRGCGGNRNNFASAANCLSYCNSAACPAGQIALQDTASRTLSTCTFSTSGTSTGCPASYTCVQSALLNQGVCCGSNAPAGTCPSGQSAYMDALTNGAQQCQQNLDGQCQSGYFCQYSVTQANSFCCGTSTITCPRGGNVFTNSVAQAQQCTPNLANNCPTGYDCQATTVLVGNIQSATGYCCGTPNPCGQGYTTQFTNNQPTTCDATTTTNTCTSPYTCIRNLAGQGYCCVASTVTVAVCAAGKSPLLLLNVPTVCTSGSASTGCPSGYTCDLYAPVNSFYCCSTGTVVTQRCPAGFNPLVPEQTCGTSPDTCPTGSGYFCSYDQTTRRYICCGGGTVVPTTTVCPAGQQLAGTSCTTDSQCSAGYNCKPSTGTGVCCPSPASVCTQPQNTGTTCTTGSSGTRYFYNTASRSCSAFTYQGCGGNTNNFASLQSCEDFCMMGLCNRGRTQYVSGQAAQTCTSDSNCQSGFTCGVPAFGGGTNVCCPSRTQTCATSQDAGRICSSSTTTPLTSWYYNSASRSCQTFSYNGCGGNGNNFQTSTDCQNYCVTTTPGANPCPNPATGQINPTTGQYQLCTFGGTGGTGCNTGFNCRYSTTSANYYCCSRVGNNGCATGVAYLYPGTNSPLQCTIGGPACPNGYTCQTSTSFLGSQCCSNAAGVPNVVNPPTTSNNAAGVLTQIVCTGTSFCQTKLNSKAICDTTQFKCKCGAGEVYQNQSKTCVPSTSGK